MDRSVTSDEQVRLFSQACPHCNVPWTEETAATAVKLAEPKIIDLLPSMGPTLRDVQRGFDDMVVECQLALAVRNDRWKDSDADEESLKDGWHSLDSDPCVTPDYEIQPGDQGLLYEVRVYHPDCAEAIREEQERAILQALQMSLVQALARARFTGVRVERCSAPRALLDMLYAEEEPIHRPDPAAFGKAVLYHAVATKQGTFGVMWMTEERDAMIVDLIGSGLLPRELAAISGRDCPLIEANQALLTDLCTLLSSRKRRLPGIG